MSARILVVDDEEIVRRSCLRTLVDGGHEVDAVDSGAGALAKIEDGRYDVLLLDIMMPKMDGIEVLRRVKEAHPDIEVIMITGLSQIATAVSAMKLGAFDYLPKPFDPDELKLAVERALERRRLLQENLTLKSEVSSRYRLENIIGASPRMQAVYRLIAKCAPTNSTVLLTGENGTGKELVARAIHYNSLRKDGPFVPVDCNALSENLLESELFGHVKGSFTGAVTSKRGLFEAARGGTLFLDEIGNISLPTQAKLLRVIQEREFRAVGDTRSQEADVRIIAATNKDLVAMVKAETFREDLYYRINIFPIHVPPLRDRREDVPALAHHFLGVFSRELGRKAAGFSDGAMNALANHRWPGNVRELENAVQRALILAGDGVIRRAHIASVGDGAPPRAQHVPQTGEQLKQAKKKAREKSVEGIEKEFVLEALRRNAWNVTRSAEETGMQRANFQALMKKYDIHIRDGSKDPAMPGDTDPPA
jgi:DNA-binding NtrC family response regulator